MKRFSEPHHFWHVAASIDIHQHLWPESLMRALANAYRDRRTRKRDMRRLWIIRINAASRLNGLPYSRFMNGLTLAGIAVDRKMLADLAVRDAAGFSAIADTAKQALAAK